MVVRLRVPFFGESDLKAGPPSSSPSSPPLENKPRETIMQRFEKQLTKEKKTHTHTHRYELS